MKTRALIIITICLAVALLIVNFLYITKPQKRVIQNNSNTLEYSRGRAQQLAEQKCAELKGIPIYDGWGALKDCKRF